MNQSLHDGIYELNLDFLMARQKKIDSHEHARYEIKIPLHDDTTITNKLRSFAQTHLGNVTFVTELRPIRGEFCGPHMYTSYLNNSRKNDTLYSIERYIRHDLIFSNDVLHSVITFKKKDNVTPMTVCVDAFCVNNIQRLKGGSMVLGFLIIICALSNIDSIELEAIGTRQTIDFYRSYGFKPISSQHKPLVDMKKKIVPLDDIEHHTTNIKKIMTNVGVSPVSSLPTLKSSDSDLNIDDFGLWTDTPENLSIPKQSSESNKRPSKSSKENQKEKLVIRLNRFANTIYVGRLRPAYKINRPKHLDDYIYKLPAIRYSVTRPYGKKRNITSRKKASKATHKRKH